jgi:hypothetical protein
MRLLIAVLLLAAPGAQAGRPFVTDDARVVDKDGCQVETFVKKQRRFDETEFWFVPACNPWGPVELSLGGTWVASALPGDSRALTAQAKTLLRPLETNGYGFAFSVGVTRLKPFEATSVVNPYFNAIGSISFADDRFVAHANLGGVRDKVANISRGTWGVGAEVLLIAPRLYGIVETYGQRGEKPTLHGGLRYWLVPDRVQLDGTLGVQHSAPPERRFHSIGLRILW